VHTFRVVPTRLPLTTLAVLAAAHGAGLPQLTLSKSHGSRGFSISDLPGLTKRGARHFLLNAHLAGRVLVLGEIANPLIENGSGGEED
jgi:hypothetical protein